MTTTNYKAVFGATKPGSLHKALGVKPGVKIPLGKLKWAMKHWSDGTERQQALAAKATLVYRFAQLRKLQKQEAA